MSGRSWQPAPRDLVAALTHCRWSAENPAPDAVAWMWAWRLAEDGKPPTRRELQQYAGWGDKRARRVLADVVQALSAWTAGNALGATNAPGAPQTGTRRAPPDKPTIDIVEAERPATAPAAPQPRPTRARDPFQQDTEHLQDNRVERPEAAMPEAPDTTSARFLALLRRWSTEPQPGKRWKVLYAADLEWFLSHRPDWPGVDLDLEIDKIDNWNEGKARASPKGAPGWTPQGWKNGIGGWLKRAAVQPKTTAKPQQGQKPDKTTATRASLDILDSMRDNPRRPSWPAEAQSSTASPSSGSPAPRAAQTISTQRARPG